MDLDGLVNRLAKFLAIKIAGTKRMTLFGRFYYRKPHHVGRGFIHYGTH